jgi:hypothetical protein
MPDPDQYPINGANGEAVTAFASAIGIAAAKQDAMAVIPAIMIDFIVTDLS